MKTLTSIIVVSIAPVLAHAHPGHLDDSPLAHSLAHGAFYLLAAVALVAMLRHFGPSIRRRLGAKIRVRRQS